MKIIIKVQILLVLLYLIVPVKGELQSLSFLSSNSVDVSSSEKNIPFTYTASESITHIQLYFRQETPTGFGRFYGWTGSGTKIQVPKFTKPGKWIIEQIDYYPVSGNSITYARNPSPFYGSWFGDGPKPFPAGVDQLEILVANTLSDEAAPTLIDFSVDMEQLRYSYEGILYAPCTITVEDNLSGFDSAYVSFGEVSADFSSYFKVNGLTNVYEGKIFFWNPEVNKIYNFESALVKDQSGNAIYISSSAQTYSDGYYQINSSSVTGTPFDNLAIQLPGSFAGLPRDSGYSSGDSSYSSVSSSDDSLKKSKKAKKSAIKKASNKKPAIAKKSSSKKSSPKKKPAAKKAKKR